ncbi:MULTISPECIES: CPBP family glutamic-type intramembrane protease [Paenibacillus]|uniref:CPBP family glutamic-type intramembrane protease n=1 Tax=Paenibacillus TaxID=44249 RepID=UPI0022B8D94D|nr:type II CAAX endopeptidase family protein [Paenibacillus caseinilyticus]MCZ8518255.1 type II CAAX endopeptidase family protein [Paenibacillus caseinilyticus]
MKKIGSVAAHVLLIVGIYFGWIFTAYYFYMEYVYVDNAWFKRNTLMFINVNDIIGLPLFYLLMRYVFKKNLFQEARYRKIAKKPVLISLMVGLAAGLFTAAFSKLPFIITNYPQFGKLFNYLNRADWYVFLVFLILGNIFKETLFRGLLLNQFRRVTPLAVAVTLQGIAYGCLFFYGKVSYTLYGFLGAVIFALLYVWFDSIWAAVLAQIACQLSQYIIWNLHLPITNGYLLGGSMAAFTLVIGAGLYAAWRHSRSAASRGAGLGADQEGSMELVV